MVMRHTAFFCGFAAATLVLAGCASTSINTSAANGASLPAPTAAASSPVTPTTSAAPSAPPTTTTTPPTTAPPPPAPPPPPPVASPASVVEAYFAAINAHDYAEAWSLGGDNLGGSYAKFAAGYADTASDALTVVGVSGHDVSIDLTATNTDGSEQSFAGTYVVSGGHITSASVSQVGSGGSQLCGAPSNPYGYNFCGDGPLITSPAGDICSYFSCIGYFWSGNGYMVECRDGEFSMSGGIDDVCSYNGGVERNVYGP